MTASGVVQAPKGGAAVHRIPRFPPLADQVPMGGPDAPSKTIRDVLGSAVSRLMSFTGKEYMARPTSLMLSSDHRPSVASPNLIPSAAV